MNISHWPISKIMQLPDHLFGERFVVSATVQGTGAVTHWDISEIGIPEVSVIWEFGLSATQIANQSTRCRVALGDQIPTNPAHVTAMSPVIMGFGDQGPDPRYITFVTNSSFHIVNIRKVLRSSGRRLVLEVTGSGELVYNVTCFIVVSRLPMDIPECQSWV